jgi:hypothetical protein
MSRRNRVFQAWLAEAEKGMGFDIKDQAIEQVRANILAEGIKGSFFTFSKFQRRKKDAGWCVSSETMGNMHVSLVTAVDTVS